ncbi:MAG: response regulator transcription factor [Dehalococcoidales bacterium]|jgi:DNA-binding NarL/FixJ family response regulator
MSTTKVVIIDKQPLFRAGVKQAFAEQGDFKIIGASPDDNLSMIIEEDLPDVILLDIDTPSLNGLKIGKSLIQRYPAIRLVVMTSEINNDELFEVIRIGAAAYLDKKSNIQELEGIIRRVARGEYPINDSLLATPTVAEHVLKQFQEMVSMGMSVESVTAPLTNRETQILHYVADGNSNKKIAQILDISEQTIKNHVSSILRKLNANDRAHAVVLAIRRGWISAND